MVTKKHLLAMICDLSGELDALYTRLTDIEHDLYRPKPIKRGTNTDGIKRKIKRPRKQK